MNWLVITCYLKIFVMEGIDIVMKKYNLREMYSCDIYNYRNDMEFVNTLVEDVRDYLTTYFDNCTTSSLFRFREFDASESIYEVYFIEQEISFTPTTVLINIERLSLLVQSISVDIVKKLIALINLLSYYYETYEDCDVDDDVITIQIIQEASQNIDKWFLDNESYIYGSYSLNEVINTGSLKDSISRLNHELFVSVLGFNFPNIDTEIDNLLRNTEDALNILINKRYSNLNFINDLTCEIYNKLKF